MLTPSLCWFRRCASICLGFLLGCGIAEVIARTCGLGQVTLTRGTLHAFHPEVGWVCAPHCDTDYELPGSFRVHVQCNSVGMRDHEFTREVPAGIQRIAVLGYSFMWGFGVENDEIFAKRIEASVPDTEVLNFGANGYSTVQELVRYQCDASSYHPRVVILAVCWNDLEDNFDSKKNGRVYLEHASELKLEIDRPAHRLSQICAEPDLPFVDLGAVFANIPRRIRCSYEATITGPPQVIASPPQSSKRNCGIKA